MKTDIAENQVTRVGIILIPGFALTSFSLAVEALSVANLQQGTPLYSYHLFSGASSTEDTQVHSSNGVPIQTEGSYLDCEDCSTIFICAYRCAAQYAHTPLLARIRQWYQQGCRFAALSSGSFLLAKSGILNKRSCTLVPEQQASFRELYPQIPVQENIYTVTDNILTCAGGTSALDMLMYLISQDHGQLLARQVSHQFLQERIRSPEEVQNKERYLSLRMKSACLGAAVEVMEANIEHPYSIQELAARVGTTTRTLEQVFKRHEDTSPGRYYLQLRLQQAHRMIEETLLPLSTIAQSTGFNSQSYFTKRFREQFGIPPRQLRCGESL